MTKLEPELTDAYTAWKAKPGLDSNAAMLQKINPILDSAVQTFGAGENSTILKSRARQIAVKALHYYDPAKGKLKSHLMMHLQGLRRASAELGQSISIPEQIRLEQSHLHETTQRMADELGRDPSDAELADHSGLSLRRLAKIRAAHSGLSEGVMSDVNTGESYQPTTASNAPPDQGWYYFIYHSLAPMDQLILEHTTGFHGKKVLSNLDLARKLRLTPSAISQRKTKIQGMLNQREELGVL